MRLDLVVHPNLVVQVTSWIILFGSLLYGKTPILFAVIDLDYVVKNWPSKRPRIKRRKARRNDLDCYGGLIDNKGQWLGLLGAVVESRIPDLEQGTLVIFQINRSARIVGIPASRYGIARLHIIGSKTASPLAIWSRQAIRQFTR